MVTTAVEGQALSMSESESIAWERPLGVFSVVMMGSYLLPESNTVLEYVPLK